jgi:hypothetical protein
VSHAEFSLFISEHPDTLIGSYLASDAVLLFDETVVSASGVSLRVALLEFSGSLIEVAHPGIQVPAADDSKVCRTFDEPSL